MARYRKKNSYQWVKVSFVILILGLFVIHLHKNESTKKTEEQIAQIETQKEKKYKIDWKPSRMPAAPYRDYSEIKRKGIDLKKSREAKLDEIEEKAPVRAPRIVKNEHGQKIVAGEFLLTFSKSTQEAQVQEFETRYGVQLLSYKQNTQTAHFKMTEESTLPLREMKDRIAKENAFVTYSGYNHIAEINQGLPSEFTQGAQIPWHIYNDGSFAYSPPFGPSIQSVAGVDIANGKYFDRLWSETPSYPDCRDVVIAILDTGVDTRHEDLKGRFWTNTNEIAGNGRDDDGNGIVDDIHGAGFSIDANGGLRVDGSPASLLDAEFSLEKFAVQRTSGTVFMSLMDQIREINDEINNQQISLQDGQDKLQEIYSSALHGTNIAGVIGGIGNNNVGTFGVCQQVKIMGLRVTGIYDFGGELTIGNISESAALAAIDYAMTYGADIINASWGFRLIGSTSLKDCGDGNLVPEPCTLYNALKAAGSRASSLGGPILTIAAAGNSDRDIDTDYETPASWARHSHMNIISVAAIDANGVKTAFSSYGAQSVQIAAPGSAILTTNLGKTLRDELEGRSGGGSMSDLFRHIFVGGSYPPFDSASGTSFAAPIIAGVAAAIKQGLIDAGKNDSASQIKEYLLDYGSGSGAHTANFGPSAKQADLSASLSAIFGGSLPAYAGSGGVTATGGAVGIGTQDTSSSEGGTFGCGFMDTNNTIPPSSNLPMLVLYALPFLLLIRRFFRYQFAKSS